MSSKTFSPLEALFYAFGMYLAASLADAVAKHLQVRLHFSEVNFIVSASGLAFMVGLSAAQRGWRKALASAYWPWHAARALVLGVMMLLVFYALKELTLPQFYVYVYTSPFFTCLFSALFLKEKIAPMEIGAIALSFFGVLVCSQADSGSLALSSGAVAAIASAFLYGVAALIARKIGADEYPPLFSISMYLGMMAVSVPYMGEHFLMPTMNEWGWSVVLSGFCLLSLLGLGVVFARSPSVAAVASMKYTQIVWGIVLGFFFFDTIPQLQTLLGGGMIIAAGLLVLYREAKKKG
ncbi:MAG: DMT family transporter [Alphaproteobacteria bacterium]|nr:DMT family transporter [Alphaproteobacteria bacterium]